MLVKIRKYWSIKVGERNEPWKFSKFAFATTKYEQKVKLEHLLCLKRGGGTNPLVLPHSWKCVYGGGGGLHATPVPFSYASAIINQSGETRNRAPPPVPQSKRLTNTPPGAAPY